MSRELVISKVLARAGFNALEVEIYLLLTKNSGQKALNIAEILKITQRKAYGILKILQEKGAVKASGNRPAQFSAVPFDKILDSFVSANREEADRIEQYERELLAKWRSLIIDSQ